MNSHTFRLSCVLTGLALVGCHKDPLADLDGTAAQVTLDFAQLTLNNGSSGTVTASVVDSRAVPLPEAVTFVSRDPTIATTANDPSYSPVPATSSRAVVQATGLGVTYVVATGAGRSDSTKVVVLPLNFDGALSSATPAGGSTLAIAGTSLLKFNPASVSVHFPTAGAATIVSKTTDTVKVFVPYGAAPGPLTISGITLAYLPGTTVSLNTAATVTVTGDFWAGDSSWQTAPDISALLPADGSSRFFIVTTGRPNAAKCPEVVLGFGSSGPCMMFRMVLPDTATYSFSVDWEGGASSPDIDVYACSDSTVSAASFNASCFEDGGGGATGAKPQEINSYQFPAGDHWFVIEVYGGGSSSNIFVTITRP